MGVIKQHHAQMAGDKPAAIITTKPSTPLIFQLPAEIRVRIWRLVLLSNRHICLGVIHVQRLRKYRLHSGKRVQAEDTANDSPFAVAMICRQVYLEATPIYYSGNTFLVNLRYGQSNLGVVQTFMETAGKENLSHISKIRIDDVYNYPACIFTELPGLKTLDIGQADVSKQLLKRMAKLSRDN